MSSLRKQVKSLGINANKKRRDYDPEDDPFSKNADDGDEDGSESDVSVNENVGREHYQSVGNSKLRDPVKTKLDDKKYGGQAVSRKDIFQDDENFDALALDEDEDEDPFANAMSGSSQDEEDDDTNGSGLSEIEEMDTVVDDDDEIESDEAFGEGEEDELKKKGFIFRGSGQALKRLPSGSGDEGGSTEISEDLGDSVGGSSDIDMEDTDSLGASDEDLEGQDESEEVEEQEDDSDNDDEEAARPRPSTMTATANSDREKLKSMMANDTAALASSLSASQSADARKGVAVKTQYQTFDRLLDARIKLQKALTTSSDLPTHSTISDEEAQAALRKAEDAALRLYSTIESLRHSILHDRDQAGSTNDKKRKRAEPSPPTHATPSTDLWTRLSTLEATSLPLRRQTLDKWSAKTRAPSSLPTSKLADPSTQSNLTSVLDTYLHGESDKLFHGATSSSNPQNLPYDDNTFYQSLLRDLIASRSATTSNSNASALPVLPAKLHTSGNAKRLDTRASKGRKIRYTVHPQLENFMAGEGRGSGVGQWNEGAVREFFGSLLGQRGVLLENADGDGDGDGDEGDAEVEALRLFRT